jgi:hypothetical protein
LALACEIGDLDPRTGDHAFACQPLREEADEVRIVARRQRTDV